MVKLRAALNILDLVKNIKQTLYKSRFFKYFKFCKQSPINRMSVPESHLKNPSYRKFYSIPEDYTHFQDHYSRKNDILLKEIYRNISSHDACFDGPYGRRRVIYCDYAASGQPLKFIEDFIKNTVYPFYGNTHTTVTATSLQSTYFRHEAKDIIRTAVNATEHDAIIFTGNGCTSAVNKLIHALNLTKPVIVFVGPFEHHSNILPWREIGAKIIRIPETPDGLVDIQFLEQKLKEYSNKGIELIGTFSAASNVTGILTDDKELSILLHKYGALALWDYATAGPYLKIDMNPVIVGEDEGLAYKDAIFLSPHKFVGGPDTPGILIAKKKMFKNPVPCEPGGGTIFFVSREIHRYLKEVEMREEGGTPSIIGAIRAGMVFQLKQAVGTALISQREEQICRTALEMWGRIENLLILGNTTVKRLPIFSFAIKHEKLGLYLHHNFVCALLNDMFGIQSRSGCACAGPYALDLLGIDETLAQHFDKMLSENSSLDRIHLRRQGEYSEREVLRPGFVRVTLPFFMSDDDINFVIEAVSLVAQFGWKMLPHYSFNPETGEWKHKTLQVFPDRKWLGSISYEDGYFTFKEQISEKIPISGMELLTEAEKMFNESAAVASKRFVPDDELVFDNESADLRWFLLPTEAKMYLLGETRTKIKNPVFIVRNDLKKMSNMNAENFTHPAVNLLSVSFQDEENNNVNANFEQLEMEKNDLTVLGNNICSLKTKCGLYQGQNNSECGFQKCKWHSPPSSLFRQFLKAVNEFHMIKDGDKVLVCLSGGKDSLSLLHTLHQYQFYSRKKGTFFQLGAVTVDPKSSSYDPSPLKSYLAALNVPYFYEEQDIISQAAEMENCTSICSFCSRLKRGRIYACARREGYNVIALGQHLDDLAESFLMSVFHNGRLRTMKAHYTDRSSSLRIIRPFVFVREKNLRKFAEEKKLPVIAENCPACFEAPKERHRMKQLLASQEVQFPTLYFSLKRALYPLMSINLTGIENNLLGKSAMYNSQLSMSDSEDDF